VKIKHYIFAFLVSGTFALIGANGVSAASVYDDTVQSTPTLSVISSDGTQNVSLSEGGDLPWYQVIYDSCNGTQFWGNRLRPVVEGTESGHIAVIQQDLNPELGENLRTVAVAWSDTSYYPTSAYWQFVTDGEGNRMVQMTNFASYYSFITIDNSGTISATCGISSNGTFTNVYEGYGYFYRSDFDVVYPDDYGGEPIPEEPVVIAPDDSRFTPNWYIHSTSDWLATFTDTNFNTFDANPFLCSDDLAPALHYEIWNETGGEELITSGVQSATAPVIWQFERLTTDNDYRIVGWYECGESPIFEHSSFIDFTITRNGLLNQDLFTDCVTEDFPFINPNNCLDNIYTVINILVFNKVEFPTWTYDPTCTNLNTFDDWLDLPSGYQVCPQFPEPVRDIVTPFVAFMLGIVTIGFINRHNRDVRGNGF